MNTKDIGERSEACILAAFVKAGYEVLFPFGGNKRYDMVIDRRNGLGFERVQCKTGRLRKGAVTFNVSSTPYASIRKTGASGRGRFCGKPMRTYESQIEMFAVYCPTNDAVYIVPIAEAGKQELNLRITPPKNAQSLHIRWAKDYLFSSSGPELTTTATARRGDGGAATRRRRARAAPGWPASPGRGGAGSGRGGTTRAAPRR